MAWAVSLRRIRILFTYNPFEGLDSYPLPGPIFIHTATCPRYDADHCPEAWASIPLMCEAYGRSRWMVAPEQVQGSAVDSAVRRLLLDKAISYMHIRNAAAGCFIAQIIRAEPEQSPGG